MALSADGLGGFDNDSADIRFIEGRSAQQFLKSSKGQLDVFALRVACGPEPSEAAVELLSTNDQSGTFSSSFLV